VRARVLAAASPPKTREDLLCLGALVARTDGGDALQAVLAALAGPTPPADVTAALDLALELLRGARDDLAERDLVQSVRRISREGPPELRIRYGVDAWPARQRGEVVRGRDLDRSLAGSTLP
jgi:hypothetical protein